MRLYFSGWQATNRERELAVIKAGHIKHRCFSFASSYKIPGFPYYLPHVGGAIDACVENGIGIMMDSGVFGYRTHKARLQEQGKSLSKLPTDEQYVQLYVDYIKANLGKYDWYATVDFAKNAADIFKCHKAIEAMGIKPVPVFHGDDSLDYIRRYHDELGHKLIAIGTCNGVPSNSKRLRQYLYGVFNLTAKLGMDAHGLALTSPHQMLDWNFWSVDSSSWSRAAGYGTIFQFNESTSRMSAFHISDRTASGNGEELKLNPKLMLRMKAAVEAEGYDFEQLRTDFVTRHIWNSDQMMRLVRVAEKKHGQSSGSWVPLV